MMYVIVAAGVRYITGRSECEREALRWLDVGQKDSASRAPLPVAVTGVE